MLIQTQRSWIIQLTQISRAKYNYQYLPYSAALLQAYTFRHAPNMSRYTFMPILLERKPLAENLRQIQVADVFGFSVYLWNMEYSLALARAIKRVKPQALIFFGGPQVPIRSEAFLRTHPEVDLCVHGEGEQVFLQLLENLPERQWENIPGISYLERGVYHQHPRGPRLPDLDQVPSPYLSGVFDPLLKAHPHYQWQAIWETNRGCPFSCTFCDWGSATQSKIYRFEEKRLHQEIAWFAQHKIHMVTCADANFGILPRDEQLADEVVRWHAQTGYPQIFFVQGAKNVTDRSFRVQQKFVTAGMSELVTLSLQSINPQTLKDIKRDNISLDTFRELQKRFQAEGVKTYTDWLLGLPGDTYDSYTNGLAQVISEGQHHLFNFFPVYILPNAELADPAYRARYGIETVKQPYLEPWTPVTQEVTEIQEMVCATATLNRADWRRARVFTWWVEMLYMYRKLLQLPILLIHALTGLNYRTIFEFYSEQRYHSAPLLSDLHAFLCQKALSIQQGQTELCQIQQGPEPHWLTVADFVLTGLSQPDVAQAFFADHKTALTQLLGVTGHHLPSGLLDEALQMSEALFVHLQSQTPFSLDLNYNLWEVYEGFLQGKPWELRSARHRHICEWSPTLFQQVRMERIA